MNTALEIKEDGQIWLWPDRPVEPNVKHSVFYPDYDKALASADRILVSNQEVARELLFLKHCIFPKEIALKEVAGIYPIPDLQWEVIDNTYIHEGSGKYWEDEPVKMKRLLNLPEEYAVISLPESLPEATYEQSDTKILADLVEILYEANGTGSGAGDIQDYIKKHFVRKVESKEDNKAFGEQDELWAKVIFEARHYNGTPHNLRALTEHFKKFYRIEKQTIL